MTDVYITRLRTDPRVDAARERMERKRLTDPDRWAWVIEQVAAIPAWYAVLSKETQPQRDKRRDKLSTKIQALADDLRADHDGRQYRVFDHASITTSNVVGRPLVSDYLDDLADEIVAKANVYGAQLFDRRISLKTFALRVTFDLLSNAQDDFFEPPNLATELLVGALLNQDIRRGTVVKIK